jgi:hypothetical protein
MKYNSSNKPLVCMQTQSACYKGTKEMSIKGVLWHSTGANNPTLKRYIQPSDTKPSADTYSKSKWLEILGKNSYGNDWNHSAVSAGLNCWIGKLADSTVTTVQTMPWNYRPWGCGSGSAGSCNDGWIQFEICEDSLSDKAYFDKVYNEACEITAYLCKKYNLDPNGKVSHRGINVPVILCHADSHKLGLGSNHGDVLHWFPKHGKTMDDVRNDVAKLLEADGGSASGGDQTEVKTYELVVDVPVYTTAADAKNGTNPKGTYEAGTYYIYSKYPDGINGMLNISKNSSGETAGGWINPADNVKKEPVQEETVQKLYRVRTSWDNAKSQKGAFISLDGAVKCCQSAGEGYKVFDWDGKEVYAYTAPEPVEPPKEPEVPNEEENEDPVEPPKAVYDLDYPDKHIIVAEASTLNEEKCTKAIVAIKKNNPNFDPAIAKAFFTLAGIYRIDPMRAVAQSILETGWFKFEGSSVKPEQHNYCGLGAVGGGVSGAAFDTIDDGVRAQLQHLYAYGCEDAIPAGESLVDPRFKYVTRGIATYWEQLAGRWAVPGFDGDDAEAAMKAGNTYGQKIDSIHDRLMDTMVSEADIKLYFNKEESTDEDVTVPDEPIVRPDVPEVAPETPEIKPDEPEDLPEDPGNADEPTEKLDVSKLNFILDLLTKLLKAIMNFFN